jgi:hypothetical protein
MDADSVDFAGYRLKREVRLEKRIYVAMAGVVVEPEPLAGASASVRVVAEVPHVDHGIEHIRILARGEGNPLAGSDKLVPDIFVRVFGAVSTQPILERGRTIISCNVKRAALDLNRFVTVIVGRGGL